MAKTHIMRWAPQDYRTSRTRARSAASRDPMLRLVYLEALSALYEAGGTLPADPSVLADELLLPARDIARCLPILDEIARSGSGRGGLLIESGWITNGRVTSDLKVEQQFREEQAERGRRGGEAKAASARQATATRAPSPPYPNNQRHNQTPAPTSSASAATNPPDPPAEPARPAVDRDEERAVRDELRRAADAAAMATGRPRDELIVEASTTTRNGASFRNEESVESVPWMRTTIERLVSMRLRANASARGAPSGANSGRKPTVGEASVAAIERFQRRDGDADRSSEVLEGTPESGGGLPEAAGRRNPRGLLRGPSEEGGT